MTKCDKCGYDRGGNKVVYLMPGVIGHVCGQCEKRPGTMFNGRPGLVYIIGSGDYWKCGVTRRNVEQRVKEMQTGNPHELIIAASWMVPDCHLGEKIAHKKLSAFHYSGEWFKGTKDQIMEAIGKPHQELEPGPGPVA